MRTNLVREELDTNADNMEESDTYHLINFLQSAVLDFWEEEVNPNGPDET